jgi:hydroxymethylbilane synthase
MTLLIGTRGRQLALTQAESVRVRIAPLWPKGDVRLEVIKTLGDGISAKDVSDPRTSGPVVGLFTRELDEALLEGKVRAAIHSLKDVPTVLPVGIQYGAFLRREDPRDAFISRSGRSLAELPAGSSIGTNSPRREAQIRAYRPDLNVVPLRGNVDTRLRKLKDGEMDAIVIAAAGLRRLGREKEITEYLYPNVMLPAPAQGVLCVTIKQGDDELIKTLAPLNDHSTEVCAKAERAFLRTLQGGCRIPVGALASLEGKMLTLAGVVGNQNGEQIMREQINGSADKPEELGVELGGIFLKSGAQEILNGFGRA